MKAFWIFILILFSTFNTYGQEKRSLSQCEESFVKNNLILLSAHYQIDQAQAISIQSKLWENPILSGELNLINPSAGKVLSIGAKGQKALAIQQLIYLGGKKQNEIDLTSANIEIAESLFRELLWNLKYQLHQNFFQLLFNLNKIQSIDKQLNRIQGLVENYQIQEQKNNVPLKDVVRLQSLLLDIRNTKAELLQNNVEIQGNLKILTGENENIIPAYESDSLNKYFVTPLTSFEDLENAALEKRPDYQITQNQIKSNELNLKWQKSLAKPDMSLGLSYDQRGGAFGNQINLTVGMPLPVWNKNQGNIKYAQSLYEQSQTDQKRAEQLVKNEINTAFLKWKQATDNYKILDNTMKQNFDLVYEGTLSNFQKGNISMLEFTDLMETYNQMVIQENDLKKNVIMQAEELNRVTNKNIF